MSEALHAAGIPIAHLKAIISGPTGFVKAAIAAHGQEPDLEGNFDASPANELELLLNLRAAGEPGIVRALVRKKLQPLNDEITMMNIDCFHPGTPVPERRIFI